MLNHTDRTGTVVTAAIFTRLNANIQRQRPLAATTKEVARPYGCAIFFVVSCGLALNGVHVVAVTTELVLHVGVIGHPIPCHYDFMFPRCSYHARLRFHCRK